MNEAHWIPTWLPSKREAHAHAELLEAVDGERLKAENVKDTDGGGGGRRLAGRGGRAAEAQEEVDAVDDPGKETLVERLGRGVAGVAGVGDRVVEHNRLAAHDDEGRGERVAQRVRVAAQQARGRRQRAVHAQVKEAHAAHGAERA